jgi:sigma-B regulation protein RsbU (phosphoserine phosphatase)
MEDKKSFALTLSDSTLKQEVSDTLASFTDKIMINDDVEGSNYIITDTTEFENLSDEYKRQYGHRIFLLSDKPDEENILKYLSKYPIHHLIGLNGKLVCVEIKSNINKILDESIWGLKHYLSEDAQTVSEGINESHKINQTIDLTLDKFDFSKYFDSPVNYLKVISNELITNALYNGVATRESLNPKEAISRKENIFLKGSEHILYTAGLDENAVAISVQDTFGKLTRTKVIESLARSFKEKTPEEKVGGAGLGLYMIYNHSNQMIFNYKRNKRTEVIALIDSNKRFKKYRERITSFHFHEEV